MLNPARPGAMDVSGIFIMTFPLVVSIVSSFSMEYVPYGTIPNGGIASCCCCPHRARAQIKSTAMFVQPRNPFLISDIAPPVNTL
jgi:hypothetical protein